jgi:hypothetical protein
MIAINRIGRVRPAPFRPRLLGRLSLLLAASLGALPALADSTAPVPAPALAPQIRDAYVVRDKMIARTVRLTDTLIVIVCKSELDAWQKNLTPKPALDLYLNGILMKHVTEIQLDSGPAVENDAQAKSAVAACAASDPAVIAAANEVQQSQTEAQAARALADKEKDPTKIDAEKKDADQKDALVQSAKQKAASIVPSTATYALDFYLDPQLVTATDTKDSWIQLLRQPWRNATIAVSVGTDTAAWPTQVEVTFQRLNVGLLAAWAALFVVAVVLFIRYARNSDIIRDTGTLPNDANGAPATARKAYSLARTQMALWTFIVAAAMVFIFMVTWNENSISSGVLVLLGVSFGTSLLASVSDGTDPTPQPSQGFLPDLLTDGTGPSFHRYQMVLFTIILAVIFVVKVATNLVMPEFDTTLLGLMGISNGTYLGFKLQGR